MVLVIFTFACVACVGCSDRPRTYPTGGVVVLRDGEPLRDGRVEVRSTEQPYTARGAIGQDGSFQLTTFELNDGAIAGRHEVLIVQRFGYEVEDVEKHRQHASSIRRLDQKYSRYETSGLTFRVEPEADNTQLRLVVESAEAP